MKRSKLTLACTCLLSSAILFSSCIGSFSLFNRLLAWNQEINDNKFVNELVFVALNIVPVYAIAGLADILVLNSIEFWSGNNPVANAGDVKTIKGMDGDYMVETTENGYIISKDEESMELIYNQESNTWSVTTEEVSSDLITLHENGTVDVHLPDKNSINVTLDAQGVLTARQATMNYSFFASR
ncbi:MAG: DUF3332 domain-containing protein [Bacteroides sp.]|nr:DUF3332 domain-containing protein [Bacteroides sp.]